MLARVADVGVSGPTLSGLLWICLARSGWHRHWTSFVPLLGGDGSLFSSADRQRSAMPGPCFYPLFNDCCGESPGGVERMSDSYPGGSQLPSLGPGTAGFGLRSGHGELGNSADPCTSWKLVLRRCRVRFHACCRSFDMFRARGQSMPSVHAEVWCFNAERSKNEAFGGE